MNIGVHDGILDRKHVDAMGNAVWLYLWCLKHQTRHNGLVLGGAPITYTRINQQLGLPERTVQRWISLLRKFGYIEVSYLAYKKMRITVLKSKKFAFKELPKQPAKSGGYVPPKVADIPPTHPPKVADIPPTHPPKVADIHTPNGGFKQSGSMRKSKTFETEEAEVPRNGNGDHNGTAASAATIRAFLALECEPFGGQRFKEFWTVEVEGYKGGSWVDAMEHVIQKCLADKVSIPPRFFHLKRRLEKLESEQAFHKTPL